MEGIDLTYTRFPCGNLPQIYWWVNFEPLGFLRWQHDHVPTADLGQTCTLK